MNRKLVGWQSLIFLSLFLGLASSHIAMAQDKQPAEKAKTKTIELTVHPRALTDASYRMTLLPEDRDLKGGNAAVVLLRMTHERQAYLTNVVPKFKQWLDAPADDPDMLREINFDYFYGQLRRAAYIRNADWNYPIDEEPLFEILLPDVQMGRDFVGRGLPLFVRKQVADGKPEVAREGDCGRTCMQPPLCPNSVRRL